MISKCSSVCILIARLIIGGIFIAGGWIKVSDMAMTVGYFNQMGLPSFLAYIVSYGEIIGGILVVIGLWSCLASIGLAIIMLGAIWATRSMGIQGMMTPLAILSSLLLFIGSGAGKYSIGSCCPGHTCEPRATV